MILILQLYNNLPGPQALPLSRPIRKTTALSYSCTTLNVTQRENGRVTRSSKREPSMASTSISRVISFTPPWSSYSSLDLLDLNEAAAAASSSAPVYASDELKLDYNNTSINFAFFFGFASKNLSDRD